MNDQSTPPAAVPPPTATPRQFGRYLVLRELRRLHGLMEEVAYKVRPQEVRPRIEAA